MNVNRYSASGVKINLVSYRYDALGRRVHRITPTERTNYGYYRDTLIREYISTLSGGIPSGDTVIKIYFPGARGEKGYGGGSLGNGNVGNGSIGNEAFSENDDIVAVYQTITKKVGTGSMSWSGYYFYEKDILGSVERVVSSTGYVLTNYRYTPFGGGYVYVPSIGKYVSLEQYIGGIAPKRIALADTGSLYMNTRLFTGREYDRETSLSYHRARYYSSQLGRFVSRDPIGIQDDMNLYRYTGNSPMSYVDRDGREKKMIGTLRIYSSYGNENLFIDGHGWIELTIGDKITTYGIGKNWRDVTKYAISNNSDITRNLEKDKNTRDNSNVVSLGLNINQSQLNIINDYINTSVDSGYQWGYLSPCTDFASDIWNMVSDIQLQDRSYAGINSPIGLSTPDALAESIAKVIVNKNEYESSGNFSKHENPYKNIIY